MHTLLSIGGVWNGAHHGLLDVLSSLASARTARVPSADGLVHTWRSVRQDLLSSCRTFLHFLDLLAAPRASYTEVPASLSPSMRRRDGVRLMSTVCSNTTWGYYYSTTRIQSCPCIGLEADLSMHLSISQFCENPK